MSGNQVDFSFLSPNELPHTRGSGKSILPHPHPSASGFSRSENGANFPTAINFPDACDCGTPFRVGRGPGTAQPLPEWPGE